VRVLVIEDEMMVSMLLEDMLSNIGYTPVGPATRMEPALKLIENARFDVAILDVNLNGDETYPIADALTARAKPFVFASGYGASRLREKYRSRFSSKNWSGRWPQPLGGGRHCDLFCFWPILSKRFSAPD
jgi:CheY-like chemotaxis protein